jgi:Mg2+ and Co2+ transporter CorA
MIDDTIREIERQIQSSTIRDERRQELLKLLETLRTEVSNISETHAEQAESIAGFARVSAHEAFREEQDPKLRELSIEGFRSSVEGFEKSHPQLVQIVNSISHTLSNLGI